MIQQCACLLAQVKGIPKPIKRNSEEPEDQPTLKRAKREHGQKNDQETNPTIPSTTNTTYIPPVTDASGLFTIDTNPSPVDQLLGQAINGTHPSMKEPSSKKRRRSGSDQHAAQRTPPQPTETTPVHTPAIERKKTKHDQELQTPQPQAQPESNIKEENDDGDEEHATAFEHKVALRLKEKEEKLQKKANKKRKRESDLSNLNVASEDVLENNDLAAHLEPESRAKRRRKQSVRQIKQLPSVVKVEDEEVATTDTKQDTTKKAKRAKRAAEEDFREQGEQTTGIDGVEEHGKPTQDGTSEQGSSKPSSKRRKRRA